MNNLGALILRTHFAKYIQEILPPPKLCQSMYWRAMVQERENKFEKIFKVDKSDSVRLFTIHGPGRYRNVKSFNLLYIYKYIYMYYVYVHKKKCRV